MPSGEVRVLGPVEVADGDVVVLLAAKLTRLLAALVVADGRACGVDELVEAVWGGPGPPSSRNLLQVYVSQVRKALPAGITLVTLGPSYALELPPACLDTTRFERLLGECKAARADENPALAASLAEQALTLWRGRAYGELAYEEFARAESERLEELRLVAREERLDAVLALGRHAEALGEILALADESPYRERAHELAMLALYRSGRQSEALEHYAAVRARLHEELGLEPTPALRELQLRVLQQDPSLTLAEEVARTAAVLPMPPTPLVGRERELSELASLLARRDARLIVLTGAGGSGKTRLALEAARRAAGSFANGAQLVELAPLRDDALVIPTIVHALGVPDNSEAEPFETLAAALAPQELLLVLDNAEHVRPATSSLAQVIARAPRLTVLVTSRAVLHVSGEQVFPVSPLPEDDAVELFVQRARLLEPGFTLDARSDEDVREICRRVDCLPLAVELAAAHVRTLTARALRDRLEQRLGLLIGGPRDLPARQQTLRETIAWSVDLLGELERDVFGKLAVFAGGATLDAAERVAGADLNTLAALVDGHLVRREEVDGEPRFGMLETVREYALELIGEGRAATELALAEDFARLADDLRAADPVVREWRRIVARLDPEVDNLRVALAAAAGSGDASLLLRLASGLWRYWATRGPLGEGLQWIERALAVDGPATAARACALQGGAGLAWRMGDNARAQDLAAAAIPVAIESGSTWDERSAHTVLGIVAKDEHDFSTARSHHERARDLAEQLGFEPVIETQNIGSVALEAGDHKEATARFEDVIERARRNDNLYAAGLANLGIGIAQFELEDNGRSRRAFEDARLIFEQVGLPELFAHALQGIAVVDASESRVEEAARLLGQARRMLDEFGAPEDMFWSRLPETRAKLRTALGDDRFEAAYAAGVNLDGEHAIG